MIETMVFRVDIMESGVSGKVRIVMCRGQDEFWVHRLFLDSPEHCKDKIWEIKDSQWFIEKSIAKGFYDLLHVLWIGEEK